LAIGLSIILGWIGVKLVIHALHKNDLPFINNGEYVTTVPEISTELSLGVIVSTLIITTIVSLIATSKDEKKPRKSKPVKKAAAKKSTSKKS
jgi:tellurite resistance protein TerC